MLTRPSYVMWMLSTTIAVVVLLMTYASIKIPVLTDIAAGKSFEFMLLAFILLWLGTVFRRL